MRQALAALLVAAAFVVCAGLAPPPPRIEYTLTPLFEGRTLQAVQVDMRFRGEADGETGLRLPSSWGGQDELWRSLTDIRVVSGATLQQSQEPARRVLSHRANARIHLRYRIIQDFDGAPDARP
jgi:predicted metalloprotease with PDZ domain